MQRAQGYKDVGKGGGYVAKLICNGWGLQWMIFGSRSWWKRSQDELQWLWSQEMVGQALTQRSISVGGREEDYSWDVFSEFLKLNSNFLKTGDVGKVKP